jgi:uncharacterized membrane protein YdjX (TVP38/TMEM64 family)
MSRSTLLRLLVLALLLGTIITILFVLPGRAWLAAFSSWAKQFGIWGLVLLAAAYIPACLIALPGTPLTLAAGLVYDVVPATIAISIGSTLGASLAFLVGRFLARGWVERRVAQNPKFLAIDRAIGEQGFKIVLLLRLSPVFPFNLLNYGLALTRVSFRDYVLASWVGMLPGTVLYVLLGAAAGAAATDGDTDTLQRIAFWGGLAVTVVATVVISRVATKALNRALAAPPDTAPGNAPHE